MKASKLRLTFDLDGGMTASVAVDRRYERDFMELYDDLHDKPLSVEIKRWREKRSKDANAYLWELCGELAVKIGATKEDVYRRHIREAGVCDVMQMTEEAVDSFNAKWKQNGVGWFAEVLDRWAGLCDVAVYYGSSTYDSSEMARLIDSVINECKEQGIETMTPAEQERMLERWEERYNKRSSA